MQKILKTVFAVKKHLRFNEKKLSYITFINHLKQFNYEKNITFFDLFI